MDNIEEKVLTKLKAIWQAGNCIKYKPDEVPVASLRDVAYGICQLFPQPLDDNIKGRLSLWEEDGKAVGELTMNKQPLDDKELREKLARKPVETHKYKGDRYLTLDCIDQILALLQPKIEEARRELIQEIENKNLVENVEILNMELPLAKKPLFAILLTVETWQALKGGEK